MMPLLKPEHLAFQDEVRRLVRERILPVAAELDEKGAFPRAAYESLRDAGLLKAALPVRYGGRDADARSLGVMIEEISRVSPSSALLVFPTSAVIRILSRTGSEEQEERFFSRMTSGGKLCAFALTEPGHGSDAGSLKTRAEPAESAYILHGSKTYVTLGEYADFYLVFVRTGTAVGPSGISALLVERNSAGLSFGKPMKKMGLGASVTEEMYFDGVPVPASNLLLGPERGWEVLTRHANPMRVWGAACMSLGMAQGALDEAVRFARRRIQFHKPIARFQAVAFHLADMKTRTEAARSLVYRSAAMVDDEAFSSEELESFVSMAKYFASDTAMEATTTAVQILGKEGVRRGAVVERLMRDAKAVQIFDGSNQIQRILVARNLLRNT